MTKLYSLGLLVLVYSNYNFPITFFSLKVYIKRLYMSFVVSSFCRLSDILKSFHYKSTINIQL